ncbi:MAG: FtsH protease activity modulator HflK [Acidobacteria bacterium]|nr:FtsH protease activity modulator HflK [Acidobacteriota bacterium]
MSQNFTIDLEKFKPPHLKAGHIRWIILIILGLILIYSSAFTVETEEVGVILRFGKYNRTVDPGLNFKLPLGLEEVYKVPVESQLKMEFGFRTVRPGVRSEYASSGYEQESIMLTGDLNAADVEWIVQYRIADPEKFLFRVRNTQETFRAMSEAVTREVVGDRTVNEVLTVGRVEIANNIQDKLQEMCRQYETGIRVEQVVLQDVNPPDPVKPAFNEVNESQQEREKLINEARSEYNRIIPNARGEAEQTIEEAQGYALERVNRAMGEAERFNQLYREYSKAPEVTRRRMYLETMNVVMNNVGRKLITDDNAAGILPLFQLDKEGKK